MEKRRVCGPDRLVPLGLALLDTGVSPLRPAASGRDDASVGGGVSGNMCGCVVGVGAAGEGAEDDFAGFAVGGFYGVYEADASRPAFGAWLASLASLLSYGREGKGNSLQEEVEPRPTGNEPTRHEGSDAATAELGDAQCPDGEQELPGLEDEVHGGPDAAAATRIASGLEDGLSSA